MGIKQYDPFNLPEEFDISDNVCNSGRCIAELKKGPYTFSLLLVHNFYLECIGRENNNEIVYSEWHVPTMEELEKYGDFWVDN
ncbi:MAG: hypothetical protein KAZ27_15710 [Saprospiraceae bacterium]|nr:hypothetical protein [Saprospiraceae bacterium]